MDHLKTLLSDYCGLLNKVDGWFHRCLEAGGGRLACRGGCSACCRGLFDITLLDAWLLQKGFAQLPQSIRQRVLSRCEERLRQLKSSWPGLVSPYLLNGMPDEAWTDMPEDDKVPCPLLDDKGECLVYAVRPLTCRLHGLPNIDQSGEDFDGTVCSLHTLNPQDLPDEILRWRFREVFTQEIHLFQDFSKLLTGQVYQELDTFIPLALLADYAKVDWQHLVLNDFRVPQLL